MRYTASLISLIALIALACGGGGDQPVPTPTTAAVERPAPESLLEPGYVLDQALNVNLDGSAEGQIVVLSHTVRQILETGDPAAAQVPARADCPIAFADFEPAACAFRAEIFSYDPSSGWTRSFVSPPPPRPAGPEDKGIFYGHRGGGQGMEDAQTFAVDARRQALVLTFSYCTGIGSGCGNYYEVVATRNGRIEVVGGGWQAGLVVEPDRAILSNPAFFNGDPLCCPSGRRVETVALDPATGEAGLIDSRLAVCAEGTYIPYELQQDMIAVRCDQEVPSTRYLVTDATVYEGTSGFAALRDGDQVRVEYVEEDCPESADCIWDRLIATRVTEVRP